MGNHLLYVIKAFLHIPNHRLEGKYEITYTDASACALVDFSVISEVWLILKFLVITYPFGIFEAERVKNAS